MPCKTPKLAMLKKHCISGKKNRNTDLAIMLTGCSGDVEAKCHNEPNSLVGSCDPPLLVCIAAHSLAMLFQGLEVFHTKKRKVTVMP